jgi:hypothetical protein
MSKSSSAFRVLVWFLLFLLVIFFIIVFFLIWRDRLNVIREEDYEPLPSEDLIQTGDIFLARCIVKNVVVRVCMAGSGSTWSHTGIFWRHPTTQVLFVLDSYINKKSIRLLKLSTMKATYSGHLHVFRRRRPLSELQCEIMQVSVINEIFRGAENNGTDLLLLTDELHPKYDPMTHVNVTEPLISFERRSKLWMGQVKACTVDRYLGGICAGSTNDSVLCTDFVAAILRRLGDLPATMRLYCTDPNFFVYSPCIRRHYSDIFCIKNVTQTRKSNLHSGHFPLDVGTEAVFWPGPYGK